MRVDGKGCIRRGKGREAEAADVSYRYLIKNGKRRRGDGAFRVLFLNLFDEAHMAEEGHVLGAASCGKDHGVYDGEEGYGGEQDTDGDPQNREDDADEGDQTEKPQESPGDEPQEQECQLDQQDDESLIGPIAAEAGVGRRDQRQKEEKSGAGAGTLYAAGTDIKRMKAGGVVPTVKAECHGVLLSKRFCFFYYTAKAEICQEQASRVQNANNM